MTKTEGKTASAAVKDILLSNPDGLREVIRAVMQEVLEAEMDEELGAAKGKRTPDRLGPLWPHADHAVSSSCGCRRIARGTSPPNCSDAISAPSGAGGNLGGDVCARGVDAEGQGDHRGAVRPCLLGVVDLGDQQTAGREPEGLCRAPASRAVCLPDSQCPLGGGARPVR